MTLEAIKRFDEAIAALAPKLPDYALFSALPGAGAQLALPFTHMIVLDF